MSRPHIGFVLERSLGHITHADNLARLLPKDPAIDAELLPVDYDVAGWPAKVPLFNSNWTVRAGLRARRALRSAHARRALDALFIHTQVPAVLCRRWIAAVPTVVSLDATPLQYDELGAHYGHETGNARLERLKWKANRACLQEARHVVTWTQWAKDGVVDGYGIAPGKVTVIPPGVTPGLWHATTPRPSNGGPLRILFVGGDLQRKGGDLLLDAFGLLRHELAADRAAPEIELHLVTKAEVAPAAGVVVHRGMQPNSPELIALYHQSDVFCLPTRGDCLPMVLSEAGAAELPLVSTAVAGIPEIVRDGETGLVVPLDDRGALVAALSSSPSCAAASARGPVRSSTPASTPTRTPTPSSSSCCARRPQALASGEPVDRQGAGAAHRLGRGRRMRAR
jgi:glycosyltransferase involved in cell wall biosynthesis